MLVTSPGASGAARAARASAPWLPTLVMINAGVVVPNLLPAIGAIWLCTPPRTAAIALYALIALLSPRLPLLPVIALFVLARLVDVFLTVCAAFFLDLPDLVEMFGMLFHLNILASPLYVALGIGLLVQLCVGSVCLVRARTAIARGSRLAFGAAVLCAFVGDVALNGTAPYAFGPVASLGQPFHSAVEESGFGMGLDPAAPKRNTLLVVVESLGELRDPAERALLLAPFDAPALRQRFDVSTGTTTFFGATSYGEMRELCHTRESYETLTDRGAERCLPRRYAAQGYRTLSMHDFIGGFYERRTWYPKVGIQRSQFREDAPPATRRCGGPFVGPCDADLAATIGDWFAHARRPTFVHWMTLNSHVPVRIGDGTPRHHCPSGGPFGDAEVCAMVEIWNDLFDAVAKLALAHPDTEILLVGDHAPPLWRRAARGHFLPDRVAWIRLAPRARPAAIEAEARPAPTRAAEAAGSDDLSQEADADPAQP